MKHVRLIRHGESAANAGKASLDHASIPLTPKGIEQARLVAKSFAKAPDLIVASPFSRAQVTAMATVAAFSSVPFETWPIHEFTYLEPARCVNTTVAQRRDWVEEYWSRSDPAFTDGEGAESFLDFISRAQAFLHKLAEHPGDDLAVFSHGQFINAVAWLIERKPQQIDGRAMADWRQYEIANHVPNCSGYQLTKHPGDAGWSLSQFALDKPLIGATGRGAERVYQAVPDPQRLLVAERATALSAREVSQVLREVTLGRRLMTKVGQQSWDQVYACHFQVDIEGWRLSIYNDCDTLDYCEECFSADGRRWSFDSGDRFGTDPIALLSTWEHQTLERMLKEL
jgi:broad specificity phosphatase PhoE